MYDKLGELQALVTKATAFNSTGVNLRTGTPRRGLKARVIVTNHSASAAGAVHQFHIEASSDDTTYVRIASSPTLLTAGTAAATSRQFIPFETSLPYVRLALSQSPTTGTPTISYKAEIGIARP